MQFYALALIAFLGLASAANLPKAPEVSYHDVVVEKLYDIDGPVKEPAETKMLLDQLVENYETYDHDEESTSEEEKTSKKFFTVLANLSELDVSRCNKKFFGGLLVLSNSFSYNSPALSTYVADVRNKQTAQCKRFGDSKFSNNITDQDVALLLLE